MPIIEKLKNMAALVFAIATLKALFNSCMALGMQFATARRGESSVSKVIGLFVGAFLFAVLMPVAFAQIFGANTTSWDATTVTVFTLVPVIVVVAFVIGIIYSITRD